MRVPLAWLRDYVELPSDPYQVAEMLAKIGFPVESIEERPAITGVVAGRIQTLEKHPNADRLQVGMVDVGSGELLTIATAATNVAAGQTIPVAIVGAQLPQIKIERRKMRGLESEGMMISADELALPPDWFEDGIMQLEGSVPLGTDIVEAFGLTHAVLEVEITGNRVDAMSVTGLARELAAYQGVALRAAQPKPLPESPGDLRVTLDSPDCTRLVMAKFEEVRIVPAPAWMRVRLALAGQRPINNVVDISNYVMLEIGQPLHFYDAAKILNGRLIVRDARQGEKLVTLDGVERTLSAKDLVIASEESAQGLAGLMGGAVSEVTGATQTVLLESATFAGPRVRRMSARHLMRTEASTRNEKTLPASLAAAGAARAAQLLGEQGAHLRAALTAGSPAQPAAPITFDPSDVQRLLGFTLPAEELREYLDRLGFKVEPASGATLLVTPPPWRRDVTLCADIIEEIARMAGYDRIESVIPSVPAHNIRSDAYLQEERSAQTLMALGYHEIATIALHGASVFEKLEAVGLAPTSRPVEVLNPLSEDQRYLRFALGPAHIQYFARIDRPVRVFEIGHVFYAEEGGPMESAVLAFGFSAEPLDEPEWRDSHFLAIKSDAEALLSALTGAREFECVADSRNGAHPGKTAALLWEGRELAFICQVDPRMQKAFASRLPVYGCWIYFERLPDFTVPRYKPASKYPSTYRDLALVCDPDLAASSIRRTIAQAIGQLCLDVRAFDEYRGPQIAAGKKSLAIRVTLGRFDTTITDEQADEAIAMALKALSEQHGVVLRA